FRLAVGQPLMTTNQPLQKIMDRAISAVGQDSDPDPLFYGQDRNPDLRRCHPTDGLHELQLAVPPRLATITADNQEVRVKIILANPRGFCAGVNMAIESLERALELFGTPLYVYHEIVHNRPVVDRFRKRGVVFVDSIQEIPEGSNVLYSAHGVAPLIREASENRRLHAIDATCPLVTKVHLEAVRFAKEGYIIILIGHEGHDEVLGTMGEAPANIRLVQNTKDVDRLDLPADAKVAYLTQTTLSVDDAEVIIAALR